MSSNKNQPLPVDITPLDPFIEPGTELPKSEVIHRFAGVVSRVLLNALKLYVFYRIGKDNDGQLYLV